MVGIQKIYAQVIVVYDNWIFFPLFFYAANGFAAFIDDDIIIFYVHINVCANEMKQKKIRNEKNIAHCVEKSK